MASFPSDPTFSNCAFSSPESDEVYTTRLQFCICTLRVISPHPFPQSNTQVYLAYCPPPSSHCCCLLPRARMACHADFYPDDTHATGERVEWSVFQSRVHIDSRGGGSHQYAWIMGSGERRRGERGERGGEREREPGLSSATHIRLPSSFLSLPCDRLSV